MLVFLAISCSKSDDNGGGNGGGGTTGDPVTSITLSTAVTDVNTDSQVVFTVKGNSNENLSSQSIFKVDGVTTSNPIMFSSEGSFEVIAEFEDLASNKITITVVDAPPTSIVLNFDRVCYSIGDSATFEVKDNFGNIVTTQAVQVVKIPWKFQKQLTGPPTTTSQAFQRFMLMGLIRDGISPEWHKLMLN